MKVCAWQIPFTAGLTRNDLIGSNSKNVAGFNVLYDVIDQQVGSILKVKTLPNEVSGDTCVLVSLYTGYLTELRMCLYLFCKF